MFQKSYPVFLLVTAAATAGLASAFAPAQHAPLAPIRTALHSMPPPPQGMPPAGGAELVDPTDEVLMDMFDTSQLPMRKMEGGGTVRTWDIPPECERLMYTIATNGRPLKAKVELWVGPIRRIHQVIINSEDGSLTPYKAMLKFKPCSKTLKISTEGSAEFPIIFGAEVPNKQRMKDSFVATTKVFDAGPKTVIQGGSTEGGTGSVRYYNIPDSVESVQMVLWSRDMGKRTVKCKIEVLHGPNSIRQLYDLHCGGSTQPYHCVIPTPGPGWTIRLIAVNYMEFPFEAVVVPFEDFGPMDDFGQAPDIGNGAWFGSDRTTQNRNLGGGMF
mmetsp:Transcript_54262/g.131666  ORF Transcript_54262/g.131666 Transcript_54262/m.131666 type:complete len:329 (+) Transcript_54262:192-1178(+)